MTAEEQRRFRALAQEVERLQRENARVRVERDRSARQSKVPASGEIRALKAEISRLNSEVKQWKQRAQAVASDMNRMRDLDEFARLSDALRASTYIRDFFLTPPQVRETLVNIVRQTRSPRAVAFLRLTLGEALRERLIEDSDIPF